MRAKVRKLAWIGVLPSQGVLRNYNSFDLKQPKLVSPLFETKRLFQMFDFYIKTQSFDVSIEPKQTETNQSKLKKQ